MRLAATAASAIRPEASSWTGLRKEMTAYHTFYARHKQWATISGFSLEAIIMRTEKWVSVWIGQDKYRQQQYRTATSNGEHVNWVSVERSKYSWDLSLVALSRRWECVGCCLVVYVYMLCCASPPTSIHYNEKCTILIICEWLEVRLFRNDFFFCFVFAWL